METHTVHVQRSLDSFGRLERYVALVQECHVDAVRLARRTVLFLGQTLWLSRQNLVVIGLQYFIQPLLNHLP